MKHADFRFLAKMCIYSAQDFGVVLYKPAPLVGFKASNRVPAVVSEVVQNKVEVVDKQRPERIIGVSRKPVPMTEDYPGAGRIAMPSEPSNGAIV